MSESIPPSLKRLGRVKNYQKDELLFHAQDEANGFYYVAETAHIFKICLI